MTVTHGPRRRFPVVYASSVCIHTNVNPHLPSRVQRQRNLFTRRADAVRPTATFAQAQHDVPTKAQNFADGSSQLSQKPVNFTPPDQGTKYFVQGSRDQELLTENIGANLMRVAGLTPRGLAISSLHQQVAL